MTTLAGAVTQLVADPKPILCLDTCDFLNVIECVYEKKNDYPASVRRLINSLKADEGKVLPVITDLVRHEWDQRLEAVTKSVVVQLKNLDQQIAWALDACDKSATAVIGPSISFAASSLVPNLIDLAKDLMSRAMILEREEICVERALARVMDKKRPSHHGGIKDSIHLEHYLEFSHQLGREKYPKPRFFVSSNQNDFGDGQGRPHSELKVEFEEAGLQYFSRLDVTLGRLDI